MYFIFFYNIKNIITGVLIYKLFPIQKMIFLNWFFNLERLKCLLAKIPN